VRKLFKEYYSPSKSEFDILWKEGAIVLDTNVLLRLHLFGKSTVDNIFSILDNLKDRLWLLFQVAEEFHRNRRDKIAEATKPLASILSDLKNCENIINNTLENLGKSVSIHPIVELEPTIKSTIEAIRAQRTGLEGRISEISTDPYYESILERVSNLFSNIVGNDVEEKHYKDLISEGIERMQSNVPPGYKDYTEKKKVTAQPGWNKEWPDRTISRA